MGLEVGGCSLFADPSGYVGRRTHASSVDTQAGLDGSSFRGRDVQGGLDPATGSAILTFICSEVWIADGTLYMIAVYWRLRIGFGPLTVLCACLFAADDG